MTTNILSEREIVVTRDFDASAAKLFAAYTDPKQIPQWWGPGKGAVKIETLDLRPGGAWRFRQRNPDGSEMVSHGTYLEVKPVTRLVYTFQVEGQPRKVTTILALRESAGKTHATLTLQFESREQRDTMAKYGAEGGARGALEALAKYLRTVN